MTSAVISPFDGGASRRPAFQRAHGKAAISFAARSGETVLAAHFEQGSAKFRFPRPPSARLREAILINTSGGLAGGDTIDIRVEVGEGARALVTTQAAEKVYRSISGLALVSLQLAVGRGARLDWLPQETILFNGAALERRLEADIAADAKLLVVEALLFGRAAMGESVIAAHFHDRWRIRRDGRLAFADDLSFSGAVADRLKRLAVLAGGLAAATLDYLGPDADSLVDPVTERLGENGGASAWNGKLVARCVAADGLALRRVLTPVLALLLDGAPIPKSWLS